MATWIFILQMLVPLGDSGFAALEAAAWTVEEPQAAADEGLRYRGLEQMFAKFEADG